MTEIKPIQFDAYFDRSTSGIEGAFTLQQVLNGKAIKLFEKLPARSGQRGWTKTDWTTEKSPIPFGHYRLWTKSLKPGKKANFDGIGEFFQISNGDQRGIIQGPNKEQRRVGVGLHRENNKPGSAGCIVLLDNTPALDDEVTRLFKFLRSLPQDYITLKVL
jgi:hypothetical protein